MSKQSLLVYDVGGQKFNAGAAFVSADGPALAGSKDWSIRHRRLGGGLSAGVDLIELDNGALSLSVVPTRGMGIWKGEYKGLPLGWQSPVRQVVNPAFVELGDRGGLGWLAGFNEWICRCGLAFNGPPGEDVLYDRDGREIARTPITLHGKIANRPAHHVELEVDDAGEGTLVVTGVVDETSLFGPCLRLESRLETTAGSNRFRIVDTVTNLGGQPAELELLYHTNIGRPFLEPAAQLVAPAIEVFPRDARAAEGAGHWNTYNAPETGYAEQAYFLKLASDAEQETEVLLRNAAGETGLSLSFNVNQLPFFTLWKNTAAEADGYVTGLEPATNLPNFKTFEREQGRVILLGAGEKYESRLDIAIFDTKAAVSQAEERIRRIQNAKETTVHDSPQKGMSPAS